MTRSASVSGLGSEFDAFLFASIGEDRNGMLLSVLSALARLDVDPWQEAAELAQLPGETAVQRLAGLIGALPDGPSIKRDPTTIAARLITFLPRRASPDGPPRKSSLGFDIMPNSRTAMYAYVVFMVFMLGVQFIMATNRSPVHVDNVHTPASSTVFPTMPPRSSGP